VRLLDFVHPNTVLTSSPRFAPSASEGRFDYAAIGTVSNVASRLCDEAKPGQILISPRVLMKVENAVKVEPVGEFELKGIRRPLAAYNVVGAV
jgi:adenylate cyclase